MVMETQGSAPKAAEARGAFSHCVPTGGAGSTETAPALMLASSLLVIPKQSLSFERLAAVGHS